MASKKKAGIGVALGVLALIIIAETAKGQVIDETITPGSAPDSSTPTSYINSVKDLAQMVSDSSGVPVAVILALSGLESAWGSSGIAKASNNYFGIHADSGWTGETYTPPGDPNNAAFRAYNSITSSFIDFANFLRQNGRYDKCFTTTDPMQFAQYLADADYSETPGYADTLKSVIKTVQGILQPV